VDAAVNDYFGISVAVYGSTAVVGAYQKQFGLGAAYVFVRSSTLWSQQAKLTPADPGSNDQFGVSAAMSGSTVVVGAWGKDSATGAAYVFVRSGSVWSEQAKLTASDAVAGNQFGVSVGVSGTTAVVGANGNNSGEGAAYVFVRSGRTWSQQAELTASDAATGNVGSFATSVAIYGSTALIGAPSGEAYVFARSGTAWSQQAELTASDATNDYFGESVANYGSTAIVGASGTLAQSGAAYTFANL
jgi:hypothetical protein